MEQTVQVDKDHPSLDDCRAVIDVGDHILSAGSINLKIENNADGTIINNHIESWKKVLADPNARPDLRDFAELITKNCVLEKKQKEPKSCTCSKCKPPLPHGHTINVLDKGYVRYIEHMGSDARIVEAARVSYKSPSKGKEADDKLLVYLHKNKHTSPMEHCAVEFNIKMPIFVMRQFIRHRTFSVNEQSARYSEMEPEFYIPKSWRKQDTKNKQGSIDEGDWNPILDVHNLGPISVDWTATKELNSVCDATYKAYQKMLKAGVAREMARMVLPVNLYTEFYVNCDLHNLMHFLDLRMDSHAQWEIQQYANAIYEIVKKLYPVTMGAFDKYKWKMVEV